MTTSEVPSLERVRHIVGEATRVNRGSATVERILQAGGIDAVEVTPAGIQRIAQAPLDRLWRAGTITTREFEAGDKFRSTAHYAAIDPGAIGADWGAVYGGGHSRVPTMFTVQYVADARLLHRETQKAVRGVVWTVLDLGLLKEQTLVEIGKVVFGRQDDREARVAGSAALRVALGALADHYERVD